MLIALAAMATGIATLVAPEEEESGVGPLAAPIERPQAMPAAMRPQQPAAGGLPARASLGKPRGDLFVARSWAPPPPVSVQQHQQHDPVPAAPPPNPYRFAGISRHNGVRKVFLLLGDRVFEAKPGELLEQGFRVQTVSEHSVTLIYEALEVSVTIATVFPDTPTASATRPLTQPR